MLLKLMAYIHVKPIPESPGEKWRMNGWKTGPNRHSQPKHVLANESKNKIKKYNTTISHLFVITV